MKTTIQTLSRGALERSGLPEQFWTLGGDTFPGTVQMRNETREYISDILKTEPIRYQGAAFVGPQGSCKTFLISMVLRIVMVNGGRVNYVTVDQLEPLMFARTQDQKDELEAITSFDGVLAIDNLNTHQNSTFCGKLEAIIDSRTDCLLPTLIAFGMQPQQLVENFKDELVNKIHKKMRMIVCEEVSC